MSAVQSTRWCCFAFGITIAVVVIAIFILIAVLIFRKRKEIMRLKSAVQEGINQGIKTFRETGSEVQATNAAVTAATATA